MALAPNSKIYFMGIGGTGMAAVAGLMQSAKFQILGSDKGVYPPMSDMLADQGIAYKTPYSVENLRAASPDLIVVANALSRGNPEIEYMLEQGLAYTSFPALLGEEILAKRSPIVVTGTHGKTTTASLVAHMLRALGRDPGYLIGGIPHNFEHGFHLGSDPLFVVEGDEYDTAFFDKGSKFLHYRPRFLIINNLEFDHADIFDSIEQIESQFIKVANLVSNPRHIIANVDDPGVAKLMKHLGRNVSTTSPYHQSQSDVCIRSLIPGDIRGKTPWRALMNSTYFGDIEIESFLSGSHNFANIAQAIALLHQICEAGLMNPPSPAAIGQAFREFKGVKRRLEHLGAVANIDVFEDFAHHPTAIAAVIEGFKKSAPSRDLHVAFEPANATGRRNILINDFADALGLADHVHIGACPIDTRIPIDQRMDTSELSQKIGASASAYETNEDLLSQVCQSLQPGDAILFMSSSSFSGIQHQIIPTLAQRFS